MSVNKRKRITAAPEPDAVAWKKLYGGLSAETQHTIDAETEAIREDLTHGSKLRTAQHFARVRKALAPDRNANAAAKKGWSLYLDAHKFPGISRATGFRIMDAWEAAEGMFHPVFLDAFATSDYAVGITPSVSSPLGKFTEAAQKIDQLKPGTNLSADEAAGVVAQVVIKWRTDKKAPMKKGRAEREVAYCKAALKAVKRLAKAFMTGREEPKSEDVLEELGLIVAHLYHAAKQQGAVTIEPKRIVAPVAKMLTEDVAEPLSKVRRKPASPAATKPRKTNATASGTTPTADKDEPVVPTGDTHEGGVPRKPPASVKVSDVSLPDDTAAPIALAHAASVADAMVDSALRKHGWPTDDAEDDAGTSPQGIDGGSGADEPGLQSVSGRG